MLGIPALDWAAAEELDVWGVDVEGKLVEAERQLRQKIQSWD